MGFWPRSEKGMARRHTDSSSLILQRLRRAIATQLLCVHFSFLISHFSFLIDSVDTHKTPVNGWHSPLGNALKATG